MNGDRRVKKRRAIYKNGDKFVNFDIFERDGWICHICKTLVDPEYRIPDIRAATVDHIIAISKGGKHVWDNCATAHAYCNWKKGGDI